MSDIFISYRREDSGGWTGRLAADLRREFPNAQVFQDIASIEIGEDFVEVVRRALASSAAVIVVIGPRWLNAKDEQGNRRLDDRKDWVRLEISESLKRVGLRVVPVQVGGGSMPRAADLPKPLKALARRNAHEITDKRWDHDISQLVAVLKKIESLNATRRSIAPAKNRPVPATPISAGSAEQLEVLRDGVWWRSNAAAADLPPGVIFRDAPYAPEMVVIPSGSFKMGSWSFKNRRMDIGPVHEVTIAYAFAAARYAVTFDEWHHFVETGGTNHRPDDEGWGRAGRPLINVSWQDAQTYVGWLSSKIAKRYRLLSEAEWEYAARAGTTTRYPWGDNPKKGYANLNLTREHIQLVKTQPVGSFEPNGFGLHDMIGNVWEWVQDCWNGSYSGAPDDGRAWESGDCENRVVRGGAYHDGQELHVASHSFRKATDRRFDTGFRVARTL